MQGVEVDMGKELLFNIDKKDYDLLSQVKRCMSYFNNKENNQEQNMILSNSKDEVFSVIRSERMVDLLHAESEYNELGKRVISFLDKLEKYFSEVNKKTSFQGEILKSVKEVIHILKTNKT